MKPFEKILDYNKLEEVTLVANTPSYLFTNFQRNQSILDLSLSNSDQQLINWFYEEYSQERTFRNLVNLYSLVIAISFKDSSHSYGFFKNLHNKTDIKWSAQLASFYFSKTSYTSYNDITIPLSVIGFSSSGANTETEVKNFEFV